MGRMGNNPFIDSSMLQARIRVIRNQITKPGTSIQATLSIVAC